MFDNFSKESKIWIFQSNRTLTEIETKKIDELWIFFQNDWNSHGHALESKMNISYNHFIIICLDETKKNASGCSIDKLTNFIKMLEKKLDLSLLDRTTVAYKTESEIEKLSLSSLKEDYKHGKITNETLVFNNLVTNLKEFENEWIVPLKNSWHNRFLS